jgi:hypothetical protein
VAAPNQQAGTESTPRELTVVAIGWKRSQAAYEKIRARVRQ